MVQAQRHRAGADAASRLHARGLSGISPAHRLHDDKSRPAYRCASRVVRHLVQGDGDSADKHDEFYDEYLSVMDLTAEFYLQTVEQVFVEHALARGVFSHRNAPVNPAAITRTALMTVEGERDDISGVGQTEAAHDLCSALPAEMRVHHLSPGVGHTGCSTARASARRSCHGSSASWRPTGQKRSVLVHLERGDERLLRDFHLAELTHLLLALLLLVEKLSLAGDVAAIAFGGTSFLSAEMVSRAMILPRSPPGSGSGTCGGG